MSRERRMGRPESQRREELRGRNNFGQVITSDIIRRGNALTKGECLCRQ